MKVGFSGESQGSPFLFQNYINTGIFVGVFTENKDLLIGDNLRITKVTRLTYNKDKNYEKVLRRD